MFDDLCAIYLPFDISPLSTPLCGLHHVTKIHHAHSLGWRLQLWGRENFTYRISLNPLKWQIVENEIWYHRKWERARRCKCGFDLVCQPLEWVMKILWLPQQQEIFQLVVWIERNFLLFLFCSKVNKCHPCVTLLWFPQHHHLRQWVYN